MKCKTVFSLLMTIAVPVAGISFAPAYAKKEVTWTYAEGEHIHNGKVFTAWTSSDSLPDTSGNWYLTSDVSIASTWAPKGDTRLCFNGYGIRLTGEGNVITAPGGKKVYFYDCAFSGEQTHKYRIDDSGLAIVDDTLTEDYETFTGGYITGGNGDNGAGIFLDVGSTKASETYLYMYGGTIIGNHTTTNGGGIAYSYAKQRDSIISLSDTSIIGNVADGQGGGIYHQANNEGMYFSGKTVIAKNVSGSAPAGVLEETRLDLSGEIHIKSNHLKDGTPSDLTVYHGFGGQDEILALDGTLDPNSRIGIDVLKYEQIDDFEKYCSANPNSILKSNKGDIYGIKDGKVVYNEPEEDFEFITEEENPSRTPTIVLPDSSSIESITYDLEEDGTYQLTNPPTFEGFGDFHFYYKIVAGLNTRKGRIDVHIVKPYPVVTLEPAAVPSLLYTGEAQTLLTA
ncbi:MAG: hypothetical protein SPL80_00195, partial [Bacilli bacterium]|nr:hypothetical protein [Bacilli bacterium]